MDRIDLETQHRQDGADMERLTAGDRAALDGLMERHAPAVFNFLCRLVGEEAEAEDLAQETFLRAWQSCGRFQSGRSFRTWALTIAANLARSRMRSHIRHPHVSLDLPVHEGGPAMVDALPASGHTPAQELLAAEQCEAVRAAVQQLPHDLREVVVLCEWERLSMSEAAEVLGTTVKAVESRLYRGRKQLRKVVSRWLDAI